MYRLYLKGENLKEVDEESNLKLKKKKKSGRVKIKLAKIPYISTKMIFWNL